MDEIYAINVTTATINVHVIAPDGRRASLYRVPRNSPMRFIRMLPVVHAICAFDSATNALLHLGKARPSLAAYYIDQNQWGEVLAREAELTDASIPHASYQEAKEGEKK